MIVIKSFLNKKSLLEALVQQNLIQKTILEIDNGVCARNIVRPIGKFAELIWSGQKKT